MFDKVWNNGYGTYDVIAAFNKRIALQRFT